MHLGSIHDLNVHYFSAASIILLLFKFLVAGLGFGLMSGAFSFVNVLADAFGPGTVGIYGASDIFFVTSGKVLFLIFLFLFYVIHSFYFFIFSSVDFVLHLAAYFLGNNIFPCCRYIKLSKIGTCLL